MTAVAVYSFPAQIPAGTAIATPRTVTFGMPSLTVEWVTWKVPPGPSGLMGFYLAANGNQMIPFASGAPNWLIADNDSDRWTLEDQTTADAWELIGYNLGVYPHTVYLRFGLSLNDTSSGSTLTPLPASSLSA